MRKWDRMITRRRAWLLNQAEAARDEATRLRSLNPPQEERAARWDAQAQKREDEAAALSPLASLPEYDAQANPESNGL
jgi:hypothetical protein